MSGPTASGAAITRADCAEKKVAVKMSNRTSFEIPGISHGSAPIPMGTRVRNVFYSSAIMGADPETGKVPADPVRQVGFAFQNMRTLLEVADVSPDDIVYVAVLLADNSLRPEVNRHWLEWFPDAADRPARHATVQELAGGMAMQLQFVAVTE